MAKKQEKQIDVIDPAHFTIEQVDELDKKTESEKEHLEAQLNHIMKGIRGKLWWWWLFPIFGWIVYSMIMSTRMQNEENQTKLILTKRKIAEKEIQLMLDKKRREELTNKTK